jgi:1-deoxy-D-xylulose-5-phosphate reductoisomerase
VVLNAADEVAVEAFLKGQIGYLDIPWVLEKVLQQTPNEPLTWDNVFQADLEARKLAQALLRVRA